MGESKALVQEINAELDQLRGTLSPDEMRKAALAAPRRLGLVVPDAGGWHARPR